MKTKILCFVTLFFTLSCAQQKTRDISAVHTPLEDEYWNDMAFDSVQSRKPILRIIEENNPALYNQILTDSKDPYLTMFWGRSLNFDSGARKKIVDDKIIQDLQAVFNIKNDNKIVHAGIMHTYGYLFSTIITPYGHKRKRWISPSLNSAFSMSENSFSPETIDGGLLSNITYFSGMLAFKNKTELGLLKNVSNEIFTFDYSKLSVDRVEETIKGYTFVTTLVSFPVKILVEENDYLLIYSIIDHTLNKEFLVTAFPVNAESRDEITEEVNMGNNKPIKLRYNAYLEGIGNNLTGTRKLIKK